MTFFLFQLNQYYQFWGIQKYEKTCFCASLTTYNLEHLNFRLLDTKCNTNIWYSASFLVFCSLLIQCILATVSPPLFFLVPLHIAPTAYPPISFCLSLERQQTSESVFLFCLCKFMAAQRHAPELSWILTASRYPCLHHFCIVKCFLILLDFVLGSWSFIHLMKC